MYDILNVGNHYLLAERFYNKGDFDNAIKYYKSTIDNYNNADNEYLLSPSSPYSITEMGKTISLPSVNEMVEICHKRLRSIKPKRK